MSPREVYKKKINCKTLRASLPTVTPPSSYFLWRFAQHSMYLSPKAINYREEKRGASGQHIVPYYVLLLLNIFLNIPLRDPPLRYERVMRLTLICITTAMLFILGMVGYNKLEVRRDLALVTCIFELVRGQGVQSRCTEERKYEVFDKYTGWRRRPPFTRCDAALNRLAGTDDLIHCTLS